VVHDPTLKALCILNTALEHLVVIWFTTNTVTEVYDARFVSVFKMYYYSTPTDKTTALVERAVFAGTDGGLYVIDQDRRKVTRTLFPINSDSIFQVTAITPGNPTSDLACNDPYNVNGFPTTAGQVANTYLYELTGPNVGTKHRVTAVKNVNNGANPPTGTFTVSSVPGTDPPTPGVGVRLGLSPVYTRWVGAPIGLSTEDGQLFGNSYDYFRTRHIDSMGVALVNVGGENVAAAEAQWYGSVWKGADSTPRLRVTPKGVGGGPIISIVNGESSNWCAFGGSLEGQYGYDSAIVSPGWECFCPGLDFRLLSAFVSGKINATLRAQRAL